MHAFSKSLDVGLHAMCRLAATEPIDEMVKALDAFAPECMNAYPSIAAMLAAEQIDGRLHIRPRIVSTSSEVRTPEMTDRIRRAWGVEPFNCLGLTETGVTAVDCAEHRGMHVFEDLCVFEVVDAAGKPVPAGQPGARVLVTNLFNRVQPMIRFEVSDIATLDDSPCACGRPFTRITSLDGRCDDVLELPGKSGRPVRVHVLHFANPMAALASVAEFQIVEQRDRLEVLVVLRHGHDGTETVRGVLADKLAALGVVDVNLSVRVVERVERERAGKLKLVKRLDEVRAPS